MGVDVVDDLQAAEDRIGVCQDALRRVLDELHVVFGHERPILMENLRETARPGLERWCRPSCGAFDETVDSYDCDDDCDCPAQHDFPHPNRWSS